MFMVFTPLCFVSTNSLGNDKYSCTPGPGGAPARHSHADTTSINNYASISSFTAKCLVREAQAGAMARLGRAGPVWMVGGVPRRLPWQIQILVWTPSLQQQQTPDASGGDTKVSGHVPDAAQSR